MCYTASSRHRVSTTPFSSICFAWRIHWGSSRCSSRCRPTARIPPRDRDREQGDRPRTSGRRQWLLAPSRGAAVDCRGGHAGARAAPRSQCNRPWRRGLRRAQRSRGRLLRDTNAPHHRGDPRLPAFRPSAARGFLDEGEPASVVLTSAREAEVLDWRLGALRRLTRVAREPEEEQGPTTTPHDQRARQRARSPAAVESRGITTDVSRLAGEHGWERLLDGRQRAGLTARSSRPCRRDLRANALLDARRLHEHDQAPKWRRRSPAARPGPHRHNARLSRRVRAAALGAQRGALGLSEVAAALNKGRAERVIYDSALRYSGAIAPDKLAVRPPARRRAWARMSRGSWNGSSSAHSTTGRACHACRRISGRQPRGRRRHHGAAAAGDRGKASRRASSSGSWSG